jgi:hypothetical protein
MRALTDNPWIREKVLQGCWAQVALCGQGMSLFRKQRAELIETIRLFVQYLALVAVVGVALYDDDRNLSIFEQNTCNCTGRIVGERMVK